MYFSISLIVFIILNTINILFITFWKKYSKLSLIIGSLFIIFSIVQIVILNISCSHSIIKFYYDSFDLQNEFFSFILERNILFFSITVIIAITLFIISFKVKYNVFHVITNICMIITFCYLIFSKGLVIRRTYINFSLMMISLITYYISLIEIPLLLKKYREHIRYLDKK